MRQTSLASPLAVLAVSYTHLDVYKRQTEDGAKERKSDAESRLAELQTLYDRRLITEEEYQQKRRKILDEL